jgi:hypothetical protein
MADVPRACSGGADVAQAVLRRRALVGLHNAHYAQLTPTDARLRRIAKASLGRALKLKKSH